MNFPRLMFVFVRKFHKVNLRIWKRLSMQKVWSIIVIAVCTTDTMHELCKLIDACLVFNEVLIDFYFNRWSIDARLYFLQSINVFLFEHISFLLLCEVTSIIFQIFYQGIRNFIILFIPFLDSYTFFRVLFYTVRNFYSNFLKLVTEVLFSHNFVKLR